MSGETRAGWELIRSNVLESLWRTLTRLGRLPTLLSLDTGFTP